MPTSASATSVASDAAVWRGSGTSQRTSAPAIGRKIRIVVSQLAHRAATKTTARTATPLASASA